MRQALSRLYARVGLQSPLVNHFAASTWVSVETQICCTRLSAPLFTSHHAPHSTEAAPGAASVLVPRHIQTQSSPCSTAATAAAIESKPPGDARDTIAALSSGPGRSGVAVIRVSGPRADVALQQLLMPGRALPQPRVAAVARLHDPSSGEQLDTGLVLRFPGPTSFTGEDVVELHVHGGPATVRATLEALQHIPGVRPAEAGEFAMRAFHNGKLDLTEAEGLADLLAAETDAQRRQALRQSGGEMRRRHERWRGQLLRCLAAAEAIIDFGEDEDIAPDVAADVAARVAAVRAELARHITAGRRGELIRSGVRVAIVGPPNAGKSSLLNVLAARDAAIVSPMPGTTRDAVEVAIELEGFKVTLVDTAGLRESADAIEVAGMQRARSAMTNADIIALVLDRSAPSRPASEASGQMQLGSACKSLKSEQNKPSRGVQSEVEDAPSSGVVSVEGAMESLNRLLAETSGAGHLCTPLDEDENDDSYTATGAFSRGGELAQERATGVELGNRQHPAKLFVVQNKSDLRSPSDNSVVLQEKSREEVNSRGNSPGGAVSQSSTAEQLFTVDSRESEEGTLPTCSVSCKTGEGIEELLGTLGRLVRQVAGNAEEDSTLITRLRHRQLLEECVAALQRYEGSWQEVEVAAEELRAAARALGKVTGAIDTEDVLDAIFSEFCIGK